MIAPQASPKWLRLSGCLLILLQTTAPAFAQNPTGGSVVAGAATISSSGPNLNVNATTNRSVINWQSFNVGAGNSANFNLPNASAAILNRVTGANSPSAIHGAINSNGNVFLVNPSGIFVGPTGVVNTNGFTASTFDIGNQQFMNGGPLTFRGSSSASVINQGTINTGAGGAHLYGNNVANSGSIFSNGGSISMAAGGTVTYNNGVTHVQADLATLQNGYSETAPLINNSGAVRATGAVMSGGDVYLTNPGGKILNSGVIQASRSVAASSSHFNHIGSINVSGQQGGTVQVQANDALIQGPIVASGVQSGGTVEIAGSNIDQFAPIDATSSSGIGGNVSIVAQDAYTATSAGDINVSGATGGTIEITGPGRIVTSADLNAVGSTGDGGQVDISSDYKTALLGASIDASGGADGGQVRIGGEFQGGRILPNDELVNSSETLVSPGTQITATGETGSGGTAIVWSDDRTQFYGGVDVSGETAGGFVELSSAGLLEYQSIGEIQTGGGTVLLDPKNGVIMDAPPSGLSMITFSLSDESSLIDRFDRFGDSVALNGPGDLLAVGATGDDGSDVTKPSSGAVYLFELDPTDLGTDATLAQVLRDGVNVGGGNTLDLDSLGLFGESVALNDNGTVLAVGAPETQPENPGPLTDDVGAVFLFNLNGSDPSAQPTLQQILQDDSPLAGGGILDLVDTEDPALQGNSVILPNDPVERQALEDRLGSDSFGQSVALNAAGNRLAVGAPSFNPSYTYLFDIDPNDLSSPANLAQRLEDPITEGTQDRFGHGVALNGIGNILAVGDRSNAVYLYNLNASNLSTPAVFAKTIEQDTPLSDGSNLVISTNTNLTGFGSSLALDDAGGLLAIGSDSLNFTGGAHLLGINPNNLAAAPTLFERLVTGTTLTNGSEFDAGFSGVGNGIALSANGEILALGGGSFSGPDGSSQSSGGVFLFDVDLSQANPLNLQQTLATDAASTRLPSNFDDFGVSVALNAAGNRLAVGEAGDGRFDGPGGVFLFELDPIDAGATPVLGQVIRSESRINTPVGSEALLLDEVDMFGSSLSFNGIGDLLAVGSAGEDGVGNTGTDTGAVYLFDLDANDIGETPFLSQVIRNQTTLADSSQLALNDSDRFGYGVAFTGDGNRLAVAADGADTVYLFESSGSMFSGPATLAGMLTDGTILSDGSTLDIPFNPLGESVAVNAAGNRLAAGERNGAGGAVLLFELNDQDWSAAPTLAQELRRDSVLADGSRLFLNGGEEFGRGVALNSAGDRLAVGQPAGFGDNEVFLFDLDPSDLSIAASLAQKIEENTPLTNGDVFQNDGQRFGQSVAFDGDGNRLAVGNPGRNLFHIFDFGGGSLDSTIRLANTLGEGSAINGGFLQSGSGFGMAVALNGAGNRLAAEADRRVYLFDVDTSLATDPTLANVIGNGTALSNGGLLDIDLSDSDFGNSLAFNDAGDILAVGDPEDDGGVYIFGLNDSNLTELPSFGQFLTETFFSPAEFDLGFSDRFGFSVDLNAVGDRIVVGAIGDQGPANETGSLTGAVYAFDLNPNDLNEEAVFRAVARDGTEFGVGGTLDLDPGDAFGSSVSLDAAGGYLVVGAPGDDGLGNATENGGTAYVFLGPVPSDPSIDTVYAFDFNRDRASVTGPFTIEAGDGFGSAVSVNADASIGVVGSIGSGGGSDGAGGIYKFDLPDPSTGGDVVLTDTFHFPELDGIGGALDLDATGNLLAVGAPINSFGTNNVRAGIGSVRLINFGGSSSSRLTGDLLFGDNPGDTTMITPAEITAILNAGNNLTLQFSNDLTIKSDVIATSASAGDLRLETGRSVLVEPGVTVDTAGGDLRIRINDDLAVAEQRDPGTAFFLVDGATLKTDAIFNQSVGRFNESDFGGRDQPVETVITNGSQILGENVFLRGVGDGTGVTINQGSLVSATQSLTISGSGGDRASGNSIGTLIEGAGTKVMAAERINLDGFGGLAGNGNHGVVVRNGAEIESASFTSFASGGATGGDGFVLDDANLVVTDSLFIIGTGDTDSSRGVDIRNGSSVTGRGQAVVNIWGDGGEGEAIRISDSSVTGFDTTLIAGAEFFNATRTNAILRLESGASVSSGDMGEVNIFLPRQENLIASSNSTINGTAFVDLFDLSGVLKNSLGIGEKVLPDFTNGAANQPYLGTPQDNYSFYLSTIDLTPGLFLQALDGSSVYGQTPIDPGISLVSGTLEPGDTIDSIGLTTNFNLTNTSDVGIYPLIIDSTNLDSAYRLVGASEGLFTILPADLLITGGTYSKTYGETFVFPENDFTVDGLVNNEAIGPVQFLSLGTRPTASVMDDPYVVSLNVSGAGSFNPRNYDISFTNGGLTVNPAPLVINPVAQAKTFGDGSIDPAAFTSTGLKNGETISQVTWQTAGSSAGADVGDYNIVANGIAQAGGGFDAGNYDITFNPLANGLMVNPADLAIRALDQTKTEGDTFNFAGTEFQSTGLKNGDTVTGATLTSPGADQDADLGTFPIMIANPTGSFDPNNYNVTLQGGDLLVVEAFVPPPVPMVEPGQDFAYDLFSRYSEFNRTVSSLFPVTVGQINTAPGTSGAGANGNPADPPVIVSPIGDVYLNKPVRGSNNVPVEVRFLTVNDQFFNQIGVDFDFQVDDNGSDPPETQVRVPETQIRVPETQLRSTESQPRVLNGESRVYDTQP